MLIAGAFLLFSLFVLLPASLAYKWEYYWITNKRIVVQKGLIGHSIQIVPLERISDIIVSRNWLEKLLGIGSLLVQSLAGQYTPYVPFGAELRLLGLTNPEEVQQLIFDLIKKKREEENLRF
jgi:membrane protein YdbS with pleckstrin-like domain